MQYDILIFDLRNPYAHTYNMFCTENKYHISTYNRNYVSIFDKIND